MASFPTAVPDAAMVAARARCTLAAAGVYVPPNVPRRAEGPAGVLWLRDDRTAILLGLGLGTGLPFILGLQGERFVIVRQIVRITFIR